MTGPLWALVAAIGFAFLQVSNRKANQLVDAYRTAFGLLVAVEAVLLLRAALVGDFGLLFSAPWSAVVIFGVTTLFHFVGGWTLLALSQQTIGVARTGALVSAAPIIGTLVAAIALDEPLTVSIVGGVLLAVIGVALISLSGRVSGSDEWRRPWFALAVALIWGSTPILIRFGLERFDHPLEGLTIGLASSVLVYATLLTATGGWKPYPTSAVRWIAFAGLCGAIAVSSQWLSFDLTTIAIAITIQQLSVIFVIALVPIMFHQPFERMNPRFFAGVTLVLTGATIVLLS
ncbi:MAG TPA: DMT family transporter [Acidimicrobiia bacterium]|nr:DMT family transporter [Acidimicrobiia bacterium]